MTEEERKELDRWSNSCPVACTWTEDEDSYYRTFMFVEELDDA